MASRKIRRGLFVTLDGPEGCGKSTQAKVLARWLRTKGFSVVFTRDPGGSPIAEEIRGLLLDPRHQELSPLAETLLYETSRASLVKKVILPALRKGKVVVCDRFSDATRVYQGIAGGVCECLIAEIDEEICEGLKPNITFFLDVSSRRGTLRLRRRGRLDRMEGKPLSFHEAVRRGYRKVAREESRRIRFIPDLPLAAVTERIQKEMTRVLQRRFGST